MRASASLSALVGVLLFLLVPSALGQSKKPTKEEKERLAKAEERFNDGEAYYMTGRFEDAITAYEEAYLLSHEPLLLLNHV